MCNSEPTREELIEAQFEAFYMLLFIMEQLKQNSLAVDLESPENGRRYFVLREVPKGEYLQFAKKVGGFSQN